MSLLGAGDASPDVKILRQDIFAPRAELHHSRVSARGGGDGGCERAASAGPVPSAPTQDPSSRPMGEGCQLAEPREGTGMDTDDTVGGAPMQEPPQPGRARAAGEEPEPQDAEMLSEEATTAPNPATCALGPPMAVSSAGGGEDARTGHTRKNAENLQEAEAGEKQFNFKDFRNLEESNISKKSSNELEDQDQNRFSRIVPELPEVVPVKPTLQEQGNGTQEGDERQIVLYQEKKGQKRGQPTPPGRALALTAGPSHNTSFDASDSPLRSPEKKKTRAISTMLTPDDCMFMLDITITKKELAAAEGTLEKWWRSMQKYPDGDPYRKQEEEEIAREMEALRALYKYEGSTLGEMLDAEYGVQNTHFVKDMFSGRNKVVESKVISATMRCLRHSYKWQTPQG